MQAERTALEQAVNEELAAEARDISACKFKLRYSCVTLLGCCLFCLQAERAALEKAVDEEIAAEAAADEAAKQQKREQIAAEERRLAEIEEQRQAEVGAGY